MGEYPILRRFTHQEYVRLERESTSKSEYVDGLIFAMAGGTANHDDVTVNAIALDQESDPGWEVQGPLI